MGRIAINGMEFHAYHGHYPEEQVVGTQFILDIIFDTDTAASEQSDELEDTVDYQHICRLIKEEMASNSKLLEHLARRIMNRIASTFSEITYLSVKVRKMNPPLGAVIESVSVFLEDEYKR